MKKYMQFGCWFFILSQINSQLLYHKTITICNPNKTLLDGIATYQQLKVPAEVRFTAMTCKSMSDTNLRFKF